jgi:hypothetical protein
MFLGNTNTGATQIPVAVSKSYIILRLLDIMKYNYFVPYTVPMPVSSKLCIFWGSNLYSCRNSEKIPKKKNILTSARLNSWSSWHSCLWKTHGQILTILCVFSLPFHPFRPHNTPEGTSVRTELHGDMRGFSDFEVNGHSRGQQLDSHNILVPFLSSIIGPLMWSMVCFLVWVLRHSHKERWRDMSGTPYHFTSFRTYLLLFIALWWLPQ